MMQVASKRASRRHRAGPARSSVQLEAVAGGHATRHWRWAGVFLLVLIAGGAVGVVMQYRRARSAAPVLQYEIIRRYPHDAGAYCQGLVIDDGTLYEGTGNYGHSSIRIVDLDSGRVIKKVDLADKYFGEGITTWQDQLIQLTWKSRRAIVYDRHTLRELKRFAYHGEGWGLTQDGRHLIMSDGTATLRFLNPSTFGVVRRLLVHDGKRRVANLNELEFIDGTIYANVWLTDRIAKIDPRSGRVVAWINLAGLYPPSQRADADCVLNGIAYDKQHQRLFVTGKHWPSLYEIRLLSPGTKRQATGKHE